jgi:L-asparaginase
VSKHLKSEQTMKITIITTGGTIEKTYNEQDGSLKNYSSILTKILNSLRLPDLEIQQRNIIFKDSLEMTDEDRDLVLRLTRLEIKNADAVIILHGTDTLEETGQLLYKEITDPSCPIIFTGAMRPYEFRDSDAVQNVTESLIAARLVSPGIYVVMHNRILKFPGVYKDRDRRTFDISV